MLAASLKLVYPNLRSVRLGNLDKKVSDLEEIRVELRDSGTVMAGLEISKVLDWESIRDLTCRTAEPGLTPPPHRHY